MSIGAGFVEAVISEAESLVGDVLSKVPAKTPIATLDGVTITLGGVESAVAFVEAVATKLRMIAASGADSFDAGADLAVFVAQQLAKDDVPYAGDAALALRLIQFIVDHNLATTQGTPATPTFHEAGR
jgi:hypothetical protein